MFPATENLYIQTTCTGKGWDEHSQLPQEEEGHVNLSVTF